MNSVRLGVLGAGGSMASAHLAYMPKIEGLEITALSEINPAAQKDLKSKFPNAELFTDSKALIASGKVDAVFIATPHYDHPVLSELAFEHGVHVLCEKPMAVTALAAATTNEKYEAARKKHPKLLYAGMFNQRNQPRWIQIKRMLSDGTLGELVRISWTITNWFRTQAYYDSGGWRATWKGEGGGVLINQCPHNLDLLCWFVGMPKRVVAASVGLGKYHLIEVEDDVNALLEFPNGATGTFVTSTGQTPGINRLEIVGTQGTLICDAHLCEDLLFLRAEQSVPEFTRTCPERFADVPTSEIRIKPAEARHQEHETISRNFIATILKECDQHDLIAPATEGIRGLELGNAMLMSGLTSKPVDLPTDRKAFDALLEKLKNESKFQKNAKVESKVDMATSFA